MRTEILHKKKDDNPVKSKSKDVLDIKLEFKNDENLNEFVIIIQRLDENGNQLTKSDENSNYCQRHIQSFMNMGILEYKNQ